jgi:hypothetical protein
MLVGCMGGFADSEDARGDGVDVAEAGSTVGTVRDHPEAGSTVGTVRDHPEAGSVIRVRPRHPEAGSVIRVRPRSPEAGSALVPRSALGPPRSPLGPSRGAKPRPGIGLKTTAKTDATAIRFENTLDFFGRILIFLVGAFIMFCLYQLGVLKPFAKELWSKQLELCCEIAQQMDVFMVAANRKNWVMCQQSLDALNDLNGRRVILLTSELNQCVLDFMKQSLDCKLSAENADYLRTLRAKYNAAIQAMRKAAVRTELLSPQVTQSLDDAHKLSQTIHQKKTDAA